ncbi:MAG: hypothetical protein ACE5KE_11985 [Methanosarcinales archaeon]
MINIPPKNTNRKNKWFQKLIWKESIQAIKDSVKFSNFNNFKAYLKENLPQNSIETRRRYRDLILNTWFFPDHSLDILAAKVWRAYHNEKILEDVMRYQYFSREPVVAEFFVNYVLPKDAGSSIEKKDVEKFLLKTYGAVNDVPLISSLKNLGVVHSSKGQIIVKEIPLPKNALLILIHDIFARTPRTVTLREILENPFWKYLGLKDKDTVKKILKEADSEGLIARYIVADELEQITTKYSLDDFLKKKVKL